MTLDERLQYIATLQQRHDEQIGRLFEQTRETEEMIKGFAAQTTEHIGALTRRMETLTERTIQAMDAINRLARIADSHENRISDLKDR